MALAKHSVRKYFANNTLGFSWTTFSDQMVQRFGEIAIASYSIASPLCVGLHIVGAWTFASQVRIRALSELVGSQ